MKLETSPFSAERKTRLICDECGNSKRFVQVMAEEVHLVDGDMNYIKLIEAHVDHYTCAVCCAPVKEPNH